MGGGTWAGGRGPFASWWDWGAQLKRNHLEVRRDATGVWVTDLHSLNGTFMNGSRIRAPTLANPCDSIGAGRVELRVVPTVALDPAWLRWNDGLVARLAQAAYHERHLPAGTLDSGRLVVLADAL
jgi:hypothetical protein